MYYSRFKYQKKGPTLDITCLSIQLKCNSFHVIIFQRPPAKRYWPDSWEMKFWRHSCCDSLMRSKNCFARFWATFFVAPLTNVTGLSLYYQLYLTEIFHLRFGTKLGHYICMVSHQLTPMPGQRYHVKMPKYLFGNSRFFSKYFEICSKYQ